MPAQQLDSETFLSRLRDSGLLASEALDNLTSLAAEIGRAKTLARLLVERGLLTRFQAEMIYRGRTDGFFLGQYRVLEQIGRGGMGRVFKAEHQTMNRQVALKVINPALMKTERARQMFEREVRATARLIHPNIVTAYDANRVGDRHYLVMEYVDGPNLQELVKERGPLAVGQACEFVRQAAVGLQYAHELGMVHRDIKPANLLVHDGGRGCVVKILDFGLARLYEPKPDSFRGDDSVPAGEHQVLGTPDYLSPEQAKDLHAADIRSDLYSLGCTLYYLLAGEPPFKGGTALEKLVRHGIEEPVDVQRLRPEVPAELAAIVRRLMAKRPQDRFQTPLDLALALTPLAAAGLIPLIDAVPASKGPRTSDSPWADIFDTDERALISTMPADLTVTPVDSGGRLRRAVISISPPTSPQRWMKFAIIALAAAAGFVLGAVSLLLLK